QASPRLTSCRAMEIAGLPIPAPAICYEPVGYMSSRDETLKQPSGRERKGHGAQPEKRAGERVFEIAADLFYRQGIRSVGVEAIVKQAGVAKISLYRSYASKDDLIVAYLED